jgi:hypothetical protein
MVMMMIEMMINRIMMMVAVSQLHIYIYILRVVRMATIRKVRLQQSYIAALIDNVKHIDAISD